MVSITSFVIHSYQERRFVDRGFYLDSINVLHVSYFYPLPVYISIEGTDEGILFQVFYQGWWTGLYV
jgi:hypothetical protein